MKRGFNILLAEDDFNDKTLFEQAVEEAAEKARVRIGVHVVHNGVEAITYLAGKGDFGDRIAHPFPDLIVLDLKMPLVTGLEVLQWLQDHSEYRRIPKVLLSGSAEDRDIEEAYRLGVNTYFQKPSSFTEYRELIFHMINYWSHTKRPIIHYASI